MDLNRNWNRRTVLHIACRWNLLDLVHSERQRRAKAACHCQRTATSVNVSKSCRIRQWNRLPSIGSAHCDCTTRDCLIRRRLCGDVTRWWTLLRPADYVTRWSAKTQDFFTDGENERQSENGLAINWAMYRSRLFWANAWNFRISFGELNIRKAFRDAKGNREWTYTTAYSGAIFDWPQPPTVCIDAGVI